MWVIFSALAAGLALGFFFPFTIPIIYARYLSIALLAALDSTFGAVRSSLEEKYDNVVFISGFFTNAALAAIITYLGERLGVDLYLAAVVALGIRLFQNLGIIRQKTMRHWGWLPKHEGRNESI